MSADIGTEILPEAEICVLGHHSPPDRATKINRNYFCNVPSLFALRSATKKFPESTKPAKIKRFLYRIDANARPQRGQAEFRGFPPKWKFQVGFWVAGFWDGVKSRGVVQNKLKSASNADYNKFRCFFSSPLPLGVSSLRQENRIESL